MYNVATYNISVYLLRYEASLIIFSLCYEAVKSQNECEGIVADTYIVAGYLTWDFKMEINGGAVMLILPLSCNFCIRSRVWCVCKWVCVCLCTCVFVYAMCVCVRVVCVCVYGVHWASCRLLGQYALEQVWRSTLSDRPAIKVARKFKIILLWKYQHNSEHFESVTCSPCHCQLIEWSH